jgi:hypothetical protein
VVGRVAIPAVAQLPGYVVEGGFASLPALLLALAGLGWAGEEMGD